MKSSSSLFLANVILLAAAFLVNSTSAKYGPALDPWLPSDWNSAYRVLNTEGDDCNIAYKGYLYDSQLAKTTDAYGGNVGEYRRLYTYAGDQIFFSRTNFSLTQYWNDYNQDLRARPCSPMYGEVLSTFGKYHITTIKQYYRTRSYNMKVGADTTAALKALEEAGGRIFATFGGLIDGDGNPVDYSQSTVISQNLIWAHSALIYGDGTGAPFGSPGATVDVSMLANFLGVLINVFADTSEKQQASGAIANWIMNHLYQDLFFVVPGTNSVFGFMPSWSSLMIDHQRSALGDYDDHLNFLRTADSQQPSCADLTHSYNHSLLHSHMLTSYFGTFYAYTMLMDVLLPESVAGPRAFSGNLNELLAELDDVHYALKNAWTIHTLSFQDLALANVKNDPARIHESFAVLFEYCGWMSEALAKIVCNLDALMRTRNMISSIDTYFSQQTRTVPQVPDDFGKIYGTRPTVPPPSP